MSNKQLLAFTRTLSSFEWRKLTQADYDRLSDFIESDGCTGVPNFYLNGCILHDFSTRTHRDLDGTPMTEQQTNKRLEEYIWAHSVFGHFSPMAWWRYWALQNFFENRPWDAMPPDITG